MLPRTRDDPRSDAERFEAVVHTFFRECGRELAHESVFEGWLAAHLAVDFGWARVICQAHLQMQHLLDEVLDWQYANQLLQPKNPNKCGFNPDICIADGRTMDCRKSQTRIDDCRNDLLKRFTVASELKLPTDVESVWRDMLRLGLMAACRPSSPPLHTFMVVIDSHAVMSSGRVEEGLGRLHASWRASVPYPVLMICRREGQRMLAEVHRDLRPQAQQVELTRTVA